MKITALLAGVSLLALAACGTPAPVTSTTPPVSTGTITTTANPTPEQALSAIVSSVAGIVPELLQAGGADQGLTSAANDIASLAQAGLTADAASAGSDILTRVSNDVNALVAQASTFTLSPQATQIIQAAQALLPFAETGLQIAVAAGAIALAPPPQA